MNPDDLKSHLHRALRQARRAMTWKLDGLSEFDRRRPCTPSGTNLLGLVKHLSGVEMLYFGVVFERAMPDPPAWFGEHAAPHADFWATEDESSGESGDLYRRASEHADTTIEQVPLDAVGAVPWLGGTMTLHQVLVHVVAETQRHAGHADIIRELIDGAVGEHRDDSQMRLAVPAGGLRDDDEWTRYRERVARTAESFADQTGDRREDDR